MAALKPLTGKIVGISVEPIRHLALSPPRIAEEIHWHSAVDMPTGNAGGHRAAMKMRFSSRSTIFASAASIKTFLFCVSA